jgi:hypothetical protein
MRWLGIILLVIGFVWIAVDICNFGAYQYTHWVWQSQNLTAGEVVKRTEAINAMHDLSISLNDRHKQILLPALCMLVGGLIVGFDRLNKTPTSVKP